MSENKVDVLLVGGGVMSATLGMLLMQLDPTLKVTMVERLDNVAHESTDGWNNAGTGHAGYCELNYTPQNADGSIDIKRALNINAAFEGMCLGGVGHAEELRRVAVDLRPLVGHHRMEICGEGRAECIGSQLLPEPRDLMPGFRFAHRVRSTKCRGADQDQVLSGEQQVAAVHDIGERPGREAHEKNGQGRRRLHECDQERRRSKPRHEPHAPHILKPRPDIGRQGGEPDRAENSDLKRRPLG